MYPYYFLQIFVSSLHALHENVSGVAVSQFLGSKQTLDLMWENIKNINLLIKYDLHARKDEFYMIEIWLGWTLLRYSSAKCSQMWDWVFFVGVSICINSTFVKLITGYCVHGKATYWFDPVLTFIFFKSLIKLWLLLHSTLVCDFPPVP